MTTFHKARSAQSFSRIMGRAVAVLCWCVPAYADTTPPLGTPPTVSADVLPTWQINGVVWSQVVVNNTAYVTGSFSKARPPGVPAGGAAEIDAQNIFAYDIRTGNPITGFNHSLNGQGLILAASPDGSRIYVGGDFTTVDGHARGHVASFVTATGALDLPFAPTVSGQVRGLAASNTTVYVGGQFSSANGSIREVSRLSMSRTVAAAVGAHRRQWQSLVDGDGSRP